MLLHIPQLLDAKTLAYCRERLSAAQWEDGKITSGSLSASIKRNQQLAKDSPVAKELGAIVLQALNANEMFFSAALPSYVMPPQFNRYENSMDLGNHIDNAVQGILGTQERIRADVSATLFFAEPEEYEGGELMIEDTYGVHEVKLAAGDLILYPSTSLHRVEPVTRGVRLASFFWVQSMVRDVGERAVLFDLDTSIRQIRQQAQSHDIATQLTGTYHNLLRRWADV
ncbi:Fe2+-dependent dioxygenase [Janthinobacterium sp. B9-8]|uniref:Fe2+-dependent dioxygenase n=1 Tax=Janthinobacterium sp. B9-8 TaxID=1236179 RepID=UPI00061D2582|nr:Fe2+-dependent dioxygenase [Janthinobacterium sp. B9-8]AMC33737.1 PKHD-type hydroxylase [Janthinobacterium sp. B9-8]